MSPMSLFSLKIVLTVYGSLKYKMNFRIKFSTSLKCRKYAV